jgi:hypothetical protein
MKGHNSEKLRQALSKWPAGELRTAASLRTQGISKSLLHYYVQQHWLELAARGLYRRPGDVATWQAALNTLQGEGAPVHVGGLSALELQGYGHYIHMGGRPLFLYGPPHFRLPTWFRGAIKGEVHLISAGFLAGLMQEGLHGMPVEGVQVIMSLPERAALEMLYAVHPGKVGFTEAFDVLGGLVAVRLELMQALLERCTSVKAKRLFLYCAREAGHKWYSKLDRGRIGLGTGKRVLIKGGRLDKEFLLTVPVNLYANMEAIF